MLFACIRIYMHHYFEFNLPLEMVNNGSRPRFCLPFDWITLFYCAFIAWHGTAWMMSTLFMCHSRCENARIIAESPLATASQTRQFYSRVNIVETRPKPNIDERKKWIVKFINFISADEASAYSVYAPNYRLSFDVWTWHKFVQQLSLHNWNWINPRRTKAFANFVGRPNRVTW